VRIYVSLKAIKN